MAEQSRTAEGIPRNYTSQPQSVAKGDHKIVGIELVTPNPWNYNKQPDEVFTKLAESLRRYGFVQPIIVRQANSKYEIINGEHRWRAASLVGMKVIPVIDLGPIDDSKAKQLTIILNELGGSPDQVRLADLLRDINTDIKFEDLATVMPFTGNELRMYIDSTSFSFDNLSTSDVRAPKEVEEAEAVDEQDGIEHAIAGESDDGDAVRKFTFSVSVEQAKTLRAALRKLHKNPSIALSMLIELWDKASAATEATP